MKTFLKALALCFVATGALAQSSPVNPIAGQLQISVTGTAVCVPAAALVNGLVLKASTTNAGNGFVGGTGVTTTDNGSGNGYRLLPGEAISNTLSNASGLCVNGSYLRADGGPGQCSQGVANGAGTAAYDTVLTGSPHSNDCGYQAAARAMAASWDKLIQKLP